MQTGSRGRLPSRPREGGARPGGRGGGQQPSTPETRCFLDVDKLAAMKRTSLLVNVSRGDLVVEQDLAAACRSGIIAGAALDVTAEEPAPPKSPLWEMENEVLTPHIVGAGGRDEGRLIRIFAENLRLWIQGSPFPAGCKGGIGLHQFALVPSAGLS
jgi:phosphoglycerate dehydrogenase-like enzyme